MFSYSMNYSGYMGRRGLNNVCVSRRLNNVCVSRGLNNVCWAFSPHRLTQCKSA